jgi:hypothetical protein
MSVTAPLIHRHCLDEYATAALPRIAPVRKHWQRAFRLETRGAVSRHYTGERPSAVTHVLRTLDALARNAGTTPWPVIAEGIVVVTQAEIRTASTAALEARLAFLDDREHDLEAQENRQTARGRNRLERAAANIAEAEVQLERAAIERELNERERGA